MLITDSKRLREAVDKAVWNTKVTDMHTHVYAPCFGDLLLWGVDELLTYHYLLAEVFRWIDISYDEFWSMSKKEQADLIWKVLFEQNSPYSEACLGILATLKGLGLDAAERNLEKHRSFFAGKNIYDYVEEVFEKAGVKDVVMTNDPFDDAERKVWLNGYVPDSRFKTALRLDQLLNNWSKACISLKEWGYDVSLKLDEKTLSEVRRFLTDWSGRLSAVYMAVSLPPDFAFPEDSPRATIIAECVLPVCRQLNIPLAMMIGVRKLVNPELKLAGDSVGRGSVETVEYLCLNYPRNKFLVTMLSRENQHALCVAARKFRNLMIFGCWWFMNNSVLIEETTRMRFEMLGMSVIPQHSDSRVLDQVVYKWEHSRKIIADVLYDKYLNLLEVGWALDDEEILRDVEKLFGGNFWDFVARKV